MAMASAMSRAAQINQEIIDNTAKLTSTSSRCGDWIVVKCLEYKDRGLPMPEGYDLEAIYAERQQVRDRINELQAELAALPANEGGEDGMM